MILYLVGVTQIAAGEEDSIGDVSTLSDPTVRRTRTGIHGRVLFYYKFHGGFLHNIPWFRLCRHWWTFIETRRLALGVNYFITDTLLPVSGVLDDRVGAFCSFNAMSMFYNQ